MAQGIERNAPLRVSCHIAEMARHIAMCRFMQRDGKQYGNGRQRNGLY